MEADLQKALEASRAEREARDDWQSRYADLEQQIEALSVPVVSPEPASRGFDWRFIGIGVVVGLVAGVAVSRWLP